MRERIHEQVEVYTKVKLFHRYSKSKVIESMVYGG